MAKDDASQDIEQQVAERLEAFRLAMAGLGITITEEEEEAKRLEFVEELGGSELARRGGEISTWEDAQRLMEESPEAIPVFRDYVKLDLKEQLVNIPFIVTSLWFSQGDVGEYVTLRVLTRDPIMTPSGPTNMVVVTDGSTGIYQQVREMVMKNPKLERFAVRTGLRVSRYTVDTEEGEKNAETFYLN